MSALLHLVSATIGITSTYKMTKGKRAKSAATKANAKKGASKKAENNSASGDKAIEIVDGQSDSGDSNNPDGQDDLGDEEEEDDQDDSEELDEDNDQEDADEEEKEEARITFSQMQSMMDMMMDKWMKASASQAAQPTVVQMPPKAKELPGLDKLKDFKGETDTDELDLWLKQLDRHCTYYGICGSLDTEDKKLAYAVSHLVGGAEAWWGSQKHQIKTYSNFIQALSKRFRSVVDADKAWEELVHLKQKDGQTVTAYSDRFVQLLTRIPTMHEDDKVRHFRMGLVPHLQQKVKEHRLSTLSEVMELAIVLEGTFAKKTWSTGGSGKAAINSVDTEGVSADQLQELLNQIKAKGTSRGAPSTAAPQGGPKGFCPRCGGRDHKIDTCKYPDWVCFFCKKPGHKKQDCEALKAKVAGQQTKNG